jgi:hypothetical protein
MGSSSNSSSGRICKSDYLSTANGHAVDVVYVSALMC